MAALPEVAEIVLRRYSKGAPLHYRRITDLAIDDGLFQPGGLTPEASMNAAITQDIKKRQARGREQRFKAYGRGMYGLIASAGPLEGAVSENNERVKEDLRLLLAEMDPKQFEYLIGGLLVALGFEGVEVTRYSSDGGIDVRATLAVGGVTEVQTAVQVKRWKSNVSGRVVRELRGGLGPHDRGLVMTLSGFTRDARREADEPNRSPISLVGGDQLIELLIEHEVGVRRRTVAVLELDESSLAELADAQDADELGDSRGARQPTSGKSLSLWPLPGGSSAWIKTLDAMLSFVSQEAPSMKVAVDWLVSSFDRVSSEKAARGYWQVARSMALTEYDGERLQLTPDGASYLQGPSEDALMRQLELEVAGITELIELVDSRPSSLEEIRHFLNDQLAVNWATDAQVRFRVGWLSLLGRVELDGDIVRPRSDR